MATKAVRVSIDVELLRRIDADPETRKRGRSAFIRSAVSSYLSAKRKREIDSAITAVYAGKGAAMSAEISDLAGFQAWPED
jgi:metal-responsive CopG/Arc/MetJ family transcriptional regulator